MNINECFRDILNDLRVELSDEFDRNFAALCLHLQWRRNHHRHHPDETLLSKALQMVNIEKIGYFNKCVIFVFLKNHL